MTGVDPKGLEAATKTWFGAQFDNFSGEHLRKVRNRMRGAITAYLAALTPLKGAPADTPPATKGVTEALRAARDFIEETRLPDPGDCHPNDRMTAEDRIEQKPLILAGLSAALASLPLPPPGEEEPGLTSHEAIKNLIGMVRAEAASWREPECYEPRDAVEEAAFLDVIANTLEALSPTAPELGAVKALELARGRLEALDGYPFAVPKDHNKDILEYIDAVLSPDDQPQTDEMQPDTYTTGDFNGVVRGKRP